MTASQGSTILPIQKATLAKLIAKYGKETTAKGKTVSSDATGDRGSSQGQERISGVVSGILSDAPDLTELLRRGNIAGSIEALTESEAQYILKFKPEAFRRKIDEVEARLRMDAQAQGAGKKGAGRFQINKEARDSRSFITSLSIAVTS